MIQIYIDVRVRIIEGRADGIDPIDGKVGNRDPDKKPVMIVVDRDDNIIDPGETPKKIASVASYSLEGIGLL